MGVLGGKNRPSVRKYTLVWNINSFLCLLSSCKLPIEYENATYGQLPDGYFPNMTFPKPKDPSKTDAPWDSCTRLDVNFSDPSYFVGGNPTDKTVGCNGNFVYDYSKYQSSARIDVSFCDIFLYTCNSYNDRSMLIIIVYFYSYSMIFSVTVHSFTPWHKIYSWWVSCWVL